MGLGRFLDRYYVINILVILSYVLLRYVKDAPDLQRPDEYLGLSRELEIIAMLCVGVFSKLNKTATVDEFIGRVILYGKTAVVILLWHIDKRIMAWYMILYCVMFLTLKPPVYDGPDDVTNLNPQTFKTKVLDAEKNKSWLVFFYADWCENCHYYQPMFADLSMRYARKNLSFGKIDVGRYQDIADDFTIDTTPHTTQQLPSMVLFKGGTEESRLPAFKSDGEVIKTVLEKKGIIAVFGLDKKKASNPKKIAKGAAKENEVSAKKKKP